MMLPQFKHLILAGTLFGCLLKYDLMVFKGIPVVFDISVGILPCVRKEQISFLSLSVIRISSFEKNFSVLTIRVIYPV
jgi:hypothetical protein